MQPLDQTDSLVTPDAPAAAELSERTAAPSTVAPASEALDDAPTIDDEPDQDSLNESLDLPETPLPPPEADEVPPESPFAGLADPLREALVEQGFTAPTEVQQAVMDTLTAGGPGRDLRISSRTGSGKTVALGLAIAPRLLESLENDGGVRPVGPTVLIVVPTRELAAQVSKELSWLFAGVRGVRVDVVTGGTNVGAEQRRLQRRPRILVGTPGRLVDHLTSESLDCSGVRELVLDEADQMLDMGFSEDLDAIVRAMPESATPENDGRRTHMVSATFSDQVLRIAQQYQHDALLIAGHGTDEAHADIDHVGHVIEGRDRYKAVVNHLLLAGNRRVLIFVATRAATGELADKLSQDGFAALPLSGDLAQSQRTRTLDAFRSGTVTALVATDVAARGLDVADVATVIHGDLPIDAETYTHRSGRTGRAGNKGRSILLTTPRAFRRAQRIGNQAGADVDFVPPPRKAQVERALAGRLRKRLTVALDNAAAAAADAALPTDETAETSTAQTDRHAFAEALLAGRDPVEVVATLVDELRGKQTVEAFDIEPAERTGRRDRDTHRDSQRGPRAMPSNRRPGRDTEAGYTRFRINWGGRQGANPKRLLATLCRRGDVDGRMIGAIDIDGFESSFDVRSEVAEHFERNARRPDNRDRQQRIERVRRESNRPRHRAG